MTRDALDNRSRLSDHSGIPAAYICAGSVNGEVGARVDKQQLAGVVTPVVTPLTEDLGLDTGSLERHVAGQIDAGVHGLWVNGTTGEFYGLDPEQRAEVVGVCVRTAAARVPVIAHVGDTSSALAIAQAKAAIAAGADAVSALPPYATAFEESEIGDHLRALAAVAGPVIFYHMPQVAGPGLSQQAIVDLVLDGVIAGVKDSSSDVLWLRRLIRTAADSGADLPCFTGGSAVSDLGYFIGAAGVASSTANLAPCYLVGQYEAARRGDWYETRYRQQQIDELMSALRLPGRTSPTAIAGVYKFLLSLTGRIGSDRGVAPLRALTSQEREQLEARAVPLIDKLEGEAGSTTRDNSYQ